MILVTGGAGMIGSNLVHELNALGRNDILVSDDLRDGVKFRNLASARICDYADRDDLQTSFDRDQDMGLEVVFHQGACSATTEWDGQYMMRVNFEYSKRVLAYCLRRRIPLIYASSAAVYGGGSVFDEVPVNERPLNVYGWSKKVFDDHVRHIGALEAQSPVVGLRYFNVYGPREAHKGSMASVAFHLHQQLSRGENPRLFGAHDGYEAGMQSRDFIHVDDVVAVNLWCWRSRVSGIFNCGTGRAEPFCEVARAVIASHGSGTIEYSEFPDQLKGRYQSYTRADISRLRHAGYRNEFRPVSEGVMSYMDWLMRNTF
jgi:ADP-L-glycero-D-manno-heptose 6-epimerase